MSRWLSLVAVLSLLGLSIGCGSSNRGVKLKGTLVGLDGQPYRYDPARETLTLQFNGAMAATAQVHADGSFEVVGPQSKGIPAGAYRVTVTSVPYGPASVHGDRFRNAFASAATSPLQVNIPASGSPKLTIDLRSRNVQTN